MGCSSCIGDKAVTVPIGYPSALEMALFLNVKKTLKPSKLIPQQQFSYINKQLQFSSFAQDKKYKITDNQPDQQNIFILTEEQKLRAKWKLLTFCFNNDFYEPEEYNMINLGLHHKCFSQIQKDLQRTFPQEKYFQSQEGIKVFQKLLKRIALFFPSVGYTQGINFIVGFLLVLQFSQEETFWMIIHLCMSPRFLMLGFFQDGFPLSSIYCKLLNHLFKTNLKDLFKHFQELGVSAEAWVFKWFMTYYLYSFPKIVAKQVWNLLMLKGGVAMIYFAFSLLQQIENELIRFQDPTQIIGFFQNLKDVSIFNSFINVKRLIERAYSVEIIQEDIQSVTKELIQQSSINNFYTQYFASATNINKQNVLLSNWYQKLKQQRIRFRTRQEILLENNGIKITRKLIPSLIQNNKASFRQKKFRIKEEEFKRTKQKNFLQKSIKASNITQEQNKNKSILCKSKPSSQNSQKSNAIQRSSISNNLQILNHSSSINEQLSRTPSEQSYYLQQQNSRRRQLTEQQISDGQLTARCNISVHVKNQPTQRQISREQQIQIFDLHQPFKKKKENTKNQYRKKINSKIKINLASKIESLTHKNSQRTIIQILPHNIIMKQQTVYSIDPSEPSIIDIDFQQSSNCYGQSLDLRFRTPQTIKNATQSIEIE